MHAYVNNERQTIEFTEEDLALLGAQMGQTIHLHSWMIIIDEITKFKLKQQIQLKKKKKEAQRALKQQLAHEQHVKDDSDSYSTKVVKPRRNQSSVENIQKQMSSAQDTSDQESKL